jgi:hypothetical protein
VGVFVTVGGMGVAVGVLVAVGGTGVTVGVLVAVGVDGVVLGIRSVSVTTTRLPTPSNSENSGKVQRDKMVNL